MTSDPSADRPDLPLVSVVCPFLNEARHLDATIASVLAQDYPAFEFILVDDGSTDASTAIARDLAERMPGRVRYLDHPGHANHGLAASRNAGLAVASGEFIAFIDGDDVWRPGKLAEQVAIMRADPQLGMVCGAVNYWSSHAGGTDTIVPTGPVQDASCEPPDGLLRVHPLGTAHAPCPSDAMFRRAVLAEAGGSEASFTGPRMVYEDQTMFARIYLRRRVHFSSRVWIDYRQHPDSCVAVAVRDGTLALARRGWVDWFERELAQSRHAGDPRIARAVAEARWALDHPVLFRLRRRLGRLMPRQRAAPGAISA